MSRFTPYSPEDAPTASRPLLEQIQRALGFVPNLFGGIAESPATLAGVLALDAALDEGTLSKVERQLVRIAVSAENRCAYCVAAHSTLATMLRAPADVVSAVREDRPIVDTRTAALVRYARALVRERGLAGEAELSDFLAAGYTKAQALEVIGHVAAKTLQNYAHALTEVRLDEAFAAQAWLPQPAEVV